MNFVPFPKYGRATKLNRQPMADASALKKENFMSDKKKNTFILLY
jgi:hypothetical protein